MLYYKLHIEATEDELEDVVGVLAEYDEILEDEEIEPDYDFMEDGNPEISDVDEVIEMVGVVAKKYPGVSLIVTGSIENHNYYMDFEVKYDKNILTKRSSDWYSSYHICAFNYDSYSAFCNETNLGDRVSESQFDEWVEANQDIAVLDSGEGEVVTKVPLSRTIEINLD